MSVNLGTGTMPTDLWPILQAYSRHLLTTLAAVAGIAALAALAHCIAQLVRQLVAQAEAEHPLILNETPEFTRSIQKATGLRDASLASVEPSLERLSAGLEAAERVLQHARHVRALDKARRKPSLTLRLVSVFSRERSAEKLAAKRCKEITTLAHQRARAWMQRRTRELATATPALAEHYNQLAAALDQAAHQEQLAREWVRLSKAAHTAMLDAKRCCKAASRTEFWELLTKNSVLDVMSTIEMRSARQAVKKASRAVGDLRSALPPNATLNVNTNIRVPSGFADLIADLTGVPPIDFVSVMNIRALNEAARRCDRAAALLARAAQHANEAASATRAATLSATAAQADYEGPFAVVAFMEVPSRLRSLLENDRGA